MKTKILILAALFLTTCDPQKVSDYQSGKLTVPAWNNYNWWGPGGAAGPAGPAGPSTVTGNVSISNGSLILEDGGVIVVEDAGVADLVSGSNFYMYVGPNGTSAACYEDTTNGILHCDQIYTTLLVMTSDAPIWLDGAADNVLQEVGPAVTFSTINGVGLRIPEQNFPLPTTCTAGAEIIGWDGGATTGTKYICDKDGGVYTSEGITF